MPRVVISGYYGFGNAGDEAMLTAIIQSLRRQGDFRFVVLSADPARTAREHCVESVGRTDVPAIRRALIGSDALISGGGSLLQDVTSPLNVPYYLGLIYLAKMLKRRVIVYGQGIGPLRGPLARRLTGAILDRCDLITVRDEASRGELGRLGVGRPPIEVTADPVLALEPPSSDRGQIILRQAGAPGDGPLVGLSPREWQGREDYKAILARAADHLVARVGARVLFVPMQRQEDERVCREIRDHMREPASILEGRFSVEELLAIFSRLDLVVGMRLHALIFAALVGTPVVGLSYDPKIDAFLESLGQEPAGTTDALQQSRVIQRLDEAWDRRRAIGEETTRRLRDLRSRADDNAVLAARAIAGAGSTSGARSEVSGRER